MTFALEYALIALAAISGLGALSYFRTAVLRARGPQPRRPGRALAIVFVSLCTAVTLLLLVGLGLVWPIRNAGISSGMQAGLTFGIVVSSLWATPLLAPALSRWTLAMPTNPDVISVRLPLGYWIAEYCVVIVGCTAIGEVAASWRSGAAIFLILPFGLVFPKLFRSLVGPQVVRGRMRAMVESLRGQSAPSDVSELREWVNGVYRRYRLKAAPTVIALNGSRSFAAYAVPEEAAILLSDADLRTMTPLEQRALTAHELAHIVRNDSRRRLMVEAFLTMWYVGLFTWWLTKHPTAPFSLRLVWLLVYSYAMQAVRTRLMRRGEFAADLLAVEMLGDPNLLISALKKLAARKKLPDRPSRTHPAFSARIAALEELL